MQVQVKCLRVLQYFPPPDDPVVAKQLNTILRQIVTCEHHSPYLSCGNAPGR